MTNYTLTCCVCALPMRTTRRPGTHGEAAHNKCRAETILSHGPGGYGKGCRCDTCRQANNERMRRYAAKRKAREGAHATKQRRRAERGYDPSVSEDCFICKEPLTNVRPTRSRYPLHKKCRNNAPAWIRGQRDNPRRAAFQARIDEAAKGTAGSRVLICGDCKWCGIYSVSHNGYCSRKCATAHKYANRAKSTFKISPRNRVALYERDKWTCRICLNPVDPALHYLHDWSATLDHIIPQAHMLIPDHSPSNLRLAHRYCNSIRGDGSNMTEIQFQARIADLWKQTA